MAEQSKASKSFQLLQDFTSYTTLHGAHFVLGTHIPLRRVIWLCLILTGFGFLTTQLIISYNKLQDRHHVLSKNTESSDHLKFPALTLCNVNMMKKSKIVGTDAKIYLDSLDIFTPLTLKLTNTSLKPLNDSFNIQEAVLKL